MPLFTVKVAESWDRIYREVEADSPEDAIQKIHDLEESGEPSDELEFVDTRDITEWFAEEEGK